MITFPLGTAKDAWNADIESRKSGAYSSKSIAKSETDQDSSLENSTLSTMSTLCPRMQQFLASIDGQRHLFLDSEGIPD